MSDGAAARADEDLRRAGHQLADAVGPAVAAWVERCVHQLLDAWSAGGGPMDDERRHQALAQASAAAAAAAAEVEAGFRALAAEDVDRQRTTPLAIVRAAVRWPTSVLTDAGVGPVRRDEMEQRRAPDDLYDLTPRSLAAIDPELGELGLRWGAAKAAAHRARHR